MRSTSTESKALRAVIAGGIATVLVAITTNVATGVLPKSWYPYLWLAWPVLGVLVVIELLLATVVYRASSGSSASQITAERAAFSRRSLLTAVREIWVDEVLAHSIHRQVMIELGFERRPDMLRNPWDLLVERPGQRPRPLEPGITPTNLLQRHGSLLILGAPGAGKTTVLLNLLEDLLAGTLVDADLPIPVVFQLNTWASSQKPLAEWLMDELRQLYGVPRAVAKYWIIEERVLPLLDGLDEVALDQRLSCARAIDEFHSEHRLIPLVVTSRVADYDSVGLRMALGAALLVHPLSRPQVDAYLNKWGEALAGLRVALHSDPTLQELLQTPFLLSVAVRAYEGLPASEVRSGDSFYNRRNHLLAAFVERALSRKPNQRTYESEKCILWLSYIARALGQRVQTLYHIEFLNGLWLPRARRLAVVIVALPAGILNGVTTGLLMNLLFSFWFGLAVGAVSGITSSWLIIEIRASETTELPHFTSRNHTKELAKRLGCWGCSALILVPVLGILGGLIGLIVGAIIGMPVRGGEIGAAAGALIALPMLTLFGPLGADDRKELRDRPTGADLHDAVWLSCALALVFGVPACVVLGTSFGPSGLLTGAVIAVAAGYQYSGRALLSYWLIHLQLVRAKLVPLRQVAFLDYAVARMLMHKIGGGYMFSHRLLLEYFAQLQPSGLDIRYQAGGLSVVDLRPDSLLASALDDANSALDNYQKRLSMMRKLTYVGSFLPAAQWAATAMIIAASLTDELFTRAADGKISSNSTLDSMVDTVAAVYRLIIGAGHWEMSPAAAFNLGELLIKILDNGADFEQSERCTAALDAYRTAANSYFPKYAGLARERLASLDPSNTVLLECNQVIVMAYKLSKTPALTPAPARREISMR